jgi:hypothetical protein
MGMPAMSGARDPTAPVIVMPVQTFDHAIDEFQDRLRDALEAFLNGDFVITGSPRWGLLRRLRISACRVPWDLFGPAMRAFRRLEAAGCPIGPNGILDSAAGRERGRWLTFAEAASHLAQLYGLLDTLLPQATPGSAEEVRVHRRYDPQEYRRRGLGAVENLGAYVQTELAPYVWGFYLHGSLSTLDYSAYSDLDDFVVIRRAVVLDPDALRRCAELCLTASRFLYQHDLLHHHRHCIVSEMDLERYSPAYLPPEVLRFATAVAGPDTLCLAVRDAGDAHRATLRDLAHGLSGWAKAPQRPRNIWHLKCLLSSVLLLPVLYLETQGTYCYKRLSFDLARAAFGPAWDAVELASQVRQVWPYRPTARERLLQHAVLDLLGNPVLFEHLMANWAQPVPRVLQALLERERFYQKVGALGEAALALLEVSQREVSSAHP